MAWTTPKTWAFQEGVESSELNTHLRDNLLAVGPHLIVRKPSDESLTSNTTLQNDDSLVMAVAANEVWYFEIGLSFSAQQSSGDIQVAFTFPASGTMAASAPGPDPSGTFDIAEFEGSTTPTAPRSLQGPASSSERRFHKISGLFINAGTAGNLQLQWAQATSNATATVVRANSTLWAVKLA